MLLYYICISIIILLNMRASAVLNPNDIRNYLATRTPYRIKHNKTAVQVKYPGCIDSKIWMMIRHGTRLPSAKDIVGMNSTLMDLRNEILITNNHEKDVLFAEQLDALRSWKCDIDPKDQKILTTEGEDEMFHMARRMHKRFPNALPDIYDQKSFLFRYTATQRAEESAKHFVKGLFDKQKLENVGFQPATKIDPVLRFYKHCDRWQKEVKKNDATYIEQNAFGRSKTMNHTLNEISKKLGLSRQITLEEAVLMYKSCGFETAWHKHRVSPWCFAFDVDTVQVMEYYHDLKHYWMDGYGHGLTYKQACLAIKTMFENFLRPTPPNSMLLFAHSGTVLKVLSHMQLFKPPEHLRADNMQKDRLWKTSDIDCFASNLAFVLFKCQDGDRVLTLHQENIVKLPMCDEELCSLKHLVEYFKDSIENCDYNDMCTLNKTEL